MNIHIHCQACEHEARRDSLLQNAVTILANSDAIEGEFGMQARDAAAKYVAREYERELMPKIN